MTHFSISLVSILAMATVVIARPQNVMIERQDLVEMPIEIIRNDKNFQQLPIYTDDENPEKKTREILDKINKVNENLNLNGNLRKEKLYQIETITEENFLNNKVDNNEKPFDDDQHINRRIIHKISYFSPKQELQNSPFGGQLLNPQYLQSLNPIDKNNIGSDLDLNFKNQLFNVPSIYLQPPQLPLQYYQSLNPPPPTRQFQYPWPFAQFFPILVKDPFISALSGFSNGFVQYGPSADVCAKENDISTPNPITKNDDEKRKGKNFKEDFSNIEKLNIEVIPNNSTNNEAFDDEEEDESESKVFFNPFAKFQKKEETPKKDEIQGKIQLPFRVKMSPDVVENPGFFINRLRVRKGGVAIAGPGGIATAGSGGTAIVGPDGVAYTKSNGLAIAGPGAKVVSLPDDLHLGRLIEKLSNKKIVDPQFEDKESSSAVEGEYVSNDEGNSNKKIFVPKGGKIVATGPTIFKNSGV